MNPNDTEESIWYFMCVARTDGFDAARKQMLTVGQDRRPVMRAAMELFRGETDEAPLQKYATNAGALTSNDAFYGNLYLGLFREAKGDAQGAKSFIEAAVATPYAKSSGDYMADLARVHVRRRGW